MRRPPIIGQSIQLQRRAGESVTVSRPNGLARNDNAGLERQFCQIVGGVLSPLLANIALGVIEERYERWTHHRRKIRAHRRCDPVTAAMGARMSDRKAGRPVFFPIRYADDCVPRTY